ncbi:NAD(P)-dependent dehydrogenase (short-subunit alcohol dehydrogenase family) [Pseudoduganella lurida]|uniref:NAD(P)-dependent dehydrogenase (Short-subunit alcohol dehydrogenase family) n=1 Tax=Pseudoduganella lurida TaxID=1036180 RepID=A0A562R5X0_9BURK|nr:short chain dehydrogenase [Pseudoduganella lurida]TWI64482.1 NAD(P)-dependent dehydrogenase (short-subunit alcohol dehydrogenase family) [Pseudoduganella lurida]
MKIIVIGAAGTIGRAVVERLGGHHDIITAGRGSGQERVAIEDHASVQALFRRTGAVDGVVVAAGALHLAPFHAMTPAQFRIGVDSKLMGQVHVALAAQHALNDGGSITLTSGIDACHAIRHGANAMAVNLALEGFVAGAALDLQRGVRINVVAPTVLTESAAVYGHLFPGFEPADGTRVALAYQRSVDGPETGKVYRVY